MKHRWLPNAVLRAASLVAPGEQRAEWLDGWRSELWYIPRRGATAFCLGAFRDALWVRRNNSNRAKRTYLESPLSCLAFLAALAAAVSLISMLLPAPERGPWPSHLRVRDLPAASAMMWIITCVLLPGVRFGMGPSPACHPSSWYRKVCRAVFLALKLALVQPVMLLGFLVFLVTGRVVAFAPQLAIGSLWILTLRWVLTDQRQRCPVCLRLLTKPVRIGTPSQTFLGWYGAESTCSRGHGLLHVSEVPSSSSANPTWLPLGNSWSALFSETAKRQP